MLDDPRAQISSHVWHMNNLAAKLDRAGFTIRCRLNFHQLSTKKNLGSSEPLLRLDRMGGKLFQLKRQPSDVSLREPSSFNHRPTAGDGQTRGTIIVQPEQVTTRPVITHHRQWNPASAHIEKVFTRVRGIPPQNEIQQHSTSKRIAARFATYSNSVRLGQPAKLKQSELRACFIRLFLRAEFLEAFQFRFNDPPLKRIDAV